MKTFSIQEFKPSIFFLLKFVGLYFVLNILYGWFVHSYYPGPDPVTTSVTYQTSALLDVTGWLNEVTEQTRKATASIIYKGRAILAVYEGCNGLNVMIIYVAFLFAFGPLSKKLYWFLILGILSIHVINLGRIYLLFHVSVYLPDFLYFTHKYFFTAIIYVAVFALWFVWIRMNTKRKIENT
jgi:exosortase family protein XrtF